MPFWDAMSKNVRMDKQVFLLISLRSEPCIMIRKAPAEHVEYVTSGGMLAMAF